MLLLHASTLDTNGSKNHGEFGGKRYD